MLPLCACLLAPPNEIEPVEDQNLLKEIQILNRLSGSVRKSVKRLRGLDEKDGNVED